MKPVNHPLIPLTFLSELATEENSIHPMNSVRMQQGIKHMLKNIITLCCLLLLWFFSDAVLANNDLANEALKETANADAKAYTSLWLESPDGTEKYVTEALSTRVTMSVSGPILRAKVKQTFRNPSQTCYI